MGRRSVGLTHCSSCSQLNRDYGSSHHADEGASSVSDDPQASQGEPAQGTDVPPSSREFLLVTVGSGGSHYRTPSEYARPGRYYMVTGADILHPPLLANHGLAFIRGLNVFTCAHEQCTFVIAPALISAWHNHAASAEFGGDFAQFLDEHDDIRALVEGNTSSPLVGLRIADGSVSLPYIPVTTAYQCRELVGDTNEVCRHLFPSTEAQRVHWHREHKPKDTTAKWPLLSYRPVRTQRTHSLFDEPAVLAPFDMSSDLEAEWRQVEDLRAVGISASAGAADANIRNFSPIQRRLRWHTEPLSTIRQTHAHADMLMSMLHGPPEVPADIHTTHKNISAAGNEDLTALWASLRGHYDGPDGPSAALAYVEEVEGGNTDTRE
jgi:hypothetical protein